MPRPEYPYYRSTFADHCKKGDIIALSFEGKDRMEIISRTARTQNLVGERSYVVMQVRLIGTQRTGQMIFPASNVVYRHTGREV